MSYQRYHIATFGPSKGGLATVGYTLTGGTRTTSGVAEVGTATGIYGALITFADGFAGAVLWDTGGGSPAYAASAVNPGDDERMDAKVSTLTPTVTIGPDGLDAVLDAPNAIGGGSIREALRAVAAVIAGDVTATANGDNTAETTVFKEFLDTATARISSLATRTSRSVTVEP